MGLQVFLRKRQGSEGSIRARPRHRVVLCSGHVPLDAKALMPGGGEGSTAEASWDRAPRPGCSLDSPEPQTRGAQATPQTSCTRTSAVGVRVVAGFLFSPVVVRDT